MNIPILGQGGSTPQPDRFDREYGGVHHRSTTAQGDVHDTEIAALDLILRAMSRKYSTRSFDLEEFNREAKDRMHRVGFAVDILWVPNRDRATGRIIPGSLKPIVEIVGRVDKTAFDHDRKVHEITHNVLELKGQDGGVIKSDGGFREGGHPH